MADESNLQIPSIFGKSKLFDTQKEGDFTDLAVMMAITKG